MQAVSSAPAHELLQRKDRADTHATRPQQRGAISAFASYGFGPVKGSGSPSDLKSDSANPITSNMHNPLKAHALPGLTAIQEMASAQK